MDNLVKYDNNISEQETAVFPHISSSESEENLRYSFKFKENDFVAGDIVVWDGEQKRVIAQEGFFLSDKYTPIGVIVIPASHMDDGHARMMATRWMNCDDPENGSLSLQRMVWGLATDLTGITNSTDIPVIARYDDENAGGVVALTEPQEIYMLYGYAYLPSNNPSINWTGETNPEDSGTKWYQKNTLWANTEHTIVGTYNFYAPSPYAVDGTPNPLYRATSYSGGSISNSLSEFDGKDNTDKILMQRGEKYYGSWKPSWNVSTDFPAASCCDMYHTVGTSQGDWYLPSAGELGYVVARLNEIGSAMAKVNGMQELSSYWSWSSTIHNSDAVCGMYFYSGCVYRWGLGKNTIYPAVAFSTI